MILNHLNLTVTDARASAEFLQKYFGLREHEGVPPSPAFAMLRDDAGFVLTLMRAKRDVAVEYPGFFHIGFVQVSEAAVDEVHSRLRADGFEAPSPARLHGSWTFYVQAPGGFVVEVLG
jgi:lactoylglutathione lyase